LPAAGQGRADRQIGTYLPANIGARLTSVQHYPHQLPAWVAFAVLCAWAASALAVGGWLMVRRDA
jgi:hypothetical protein